MDIDTKLSSKHKFINRLQTLLLLLGMLLILALISRLLLGPDIWLWFFIGLLLTLYSLRNLSSYWVLRFYQAHSIHPRESPPLFSLITELSQRAGLSTIPRLYWIPSQTVNAFATGSKKEPTVAITDGLLKLLTPRELAAVLAHEVSHIRNNDLFIMSLADTFSRFTHLLSIIGLLTIVLSLPWIIMGKIDISLIGLLLLIISPAISALLQLGLSRVREFDADLDAAKLTSDPAGLAQALLKINHQNTSPLLHILMPGYRDYQPSILRSHPKTKHRVERLRALEKSEQVTNHPLNLHFKSVFHPYAHVMIRRPKQRFFSGIWR